MMGCVFRNKIALDPALCLGKGSLKINYKRRKVEKVFLFE